MAQAEKKATRALPYRPSDRIRIEHPKTGEAYGVTGSAFSSTYKGSGFRAVSFEDGTPFRETKAEQAAAEQAAEAEASEPTAAAEATEEAPG
jgi:hypothetical protein